MFLTMLLCGAGLGAAYDALWLIRRTILRGRATCALLDLLFGVICAAGVIFSALCLRADAFRWYTLLGAAAGMALYAASLGALVRRVAVALIRICKNKSRKGRKMTK